MSFGRAIKRKAKAAVAPCVFLLLSAYFVWNATQGEHGLRANALRQQDVRAAEDEQARATADLATWERRVASLRNNRLDQDALDERARAILNLAEPGDVVVPLKRSERIF